MREVFLSAGHTNNPKRDRGATSSYGVEGEETVKVRQALSLELKNYGISVTIDSNDSTLIQTINYFKTLTTSHCIVIDIHFNSSISPNSTGVEVLIPEKNTEFERQFGSSISTTISEVLGIPTRGVHRGLKGIKTELESHHGRLGWMRLTGENILIELCFINNKEDMEKYRKNFSKLISELAKVIFSYSVVKDVCNCPLIQEEFHIVKPGDTLWSISVINKTTVTSIKKANNLTSDVLKVGQKLLLK